MRGSKNYRFLLLWFNQFLDAFFYFDIMTSTHKGEFILLEITQNCFYQQFKSLTGMETIPLIW